MPADFRIEIVDGSTPGSSTPQTPAQPPANTPGAQPSAPVPGRPASPQSSQQGAGKSGADLVGAIAQGIGGPLGAFVAALSALVKEVRGARASTPSAGSPPLPGPSGGLPGAAPSSPPIPSPPSTPNIPPIPSPAGAGARGAAAGASAAGSSGAAAAGGATAAAGSAAGGLGAIASVAGPVAIGLGIMALSAKEASSAIGPLGVVVGALNPALGLMLGAVKRFGDAIGAEAQRFKDVSPDVAMAIAQNDASREMSRLRQAETIGPTLARFERTRGRASEVLSESITDLKAALLRILEPLLPIIERGAEIAAGTTTLIAALLEELQALSALTSGQIQASMEHHAEAVKLAEKSIKTIRGLKEDDAAMVDPMLMKALGLLDQVDRNFMRGANPRVLPQFAQMNPG